MQKTKSKYNGKLVEEQKPTETDEVFVADFYVPNYSHHLVNFWVILDRFVSKMAGPMMYTFYSLSSITTAVLIGTG